MQKLQNTALITELIRAKKVNYQELADAIGRSLVWTALALHGQAAMDEAEANKIGEVLGLNEEHINHCRRYRQEVHWSICPLLILHNTGFMNYCSSTDPP